jgi:hypothetical protein
MYLMRWFVTVGELIINILIFLLRLTANLDAKVAIS